RAWLEHKQDRPVSEAVAANRWREEGYDPVIAEIPGDLRGRLPPAEIFCEVLQHRWYMSEAAGRDGGPTPPAPGHFKKGLLAPPEPVEDATAASEMTTDEAVVGLSA